MAQRWRGYVLAAETAEVLGVSQSTRRAWTASGTFPMRQNPANGYRLFRRSDLDRFLKRVSRPVKPK